ncbi:mannose-6-phosphate isomerase, class I, partial [Vibrio parahaemolyticus EKP-021]
ILIKENRFLFQRMQKNIYSNQ